MNKTYLEIYVNGILHKRHDITNEDEEKVKAYCANAMMFETIEIQERVTKRKLKLGQINKLTTEKIY
jgi:hypothetical protein